MKSYTWPEGPSEFYVPRGGFTLDAGYISSVDDLTKDLPIYVNSMADVESTLVNRAYFHLERDGGGTKIGDFYVELLSGWQGVYPDAPVQDWIDFVRSASHGTWLYYVYFETHRDYIELRPAQNKDVGALRKKRDIRVQELDDRPTVRNWLGKRATDMMRSQAHNPQRR